jgi:hypothetical protein
MLSSVLGSMQLGRELFDQAVRELAAGTGEALATLKRSLDAKSEHVKVRAATVWLDQVLRFNEALDLDERVAALEQAAEVERQIQAGELSGPSGSPR